MTQVQDNVLAEIEGKNGEHNVIVKRRYIQREEKVEISDEEYAQMLLRGE